MTKSVRSSLSSSAAPPCVIFDLRISADTGTRQRRRRTISRPSKTFPRRHACSDGFSGVSFLDSPGDPGQNQAATRSTFVKFNSLAGEPHSQVRLADDRVVATKRGEYLAAQHRSPNLPGRIGVFPFVPLLRHSNQVAVLRVLPA